MQYEVSYLINIFGSIHFKYIKYANDEALERIPLKDYTWSGTYLFKWSYQHLKLWKPIWFRIIWYKCKNSRLKVIRNLGILTYVIGSYINLIFNILSFPVVYIRRCLIMYKRLYNRCYSSEVIPKLINKKPNIL